MFSLRSLQGGVLQATPKYNSSMLEDLFLEDNAEFVKRTFLGWKELGEALILLKVCMPNSSVILNLGAITPDAWMEKNLAYFMML